MPLVIRRTGADEYGLFTKMLICGDAGAGKTRSTATWPNPLIASVGANLMSVADRGVPFVDIKTSLDLENLRKQLNNPPEVRAELFGTPVDTVSIDTLDHFQQVLASERKRDEKKDALAIGDWGWLGDEMRGVLRGFRNLPLNVIFVCHLKLTEDAEANRIYFRPSLQGAVGDEVAGYVDVALALTSTSYNEVDPTDGSTTRKVARYAQTYPDHQHPWIRDNSGKLPPEFEINFTDDYARLHAAIYTADALPASDVLAYISEPEPEAVPEPPKTTGPKRVAAEKPAPKAPKAASAPPEPKPEPDLPVPASASSASTTESDKNESPEETTPPPFEPPPIAAVPDPPEFASEDAAAEALTAELTGNTPALPLCSTCGGEIDSIDQVELSTILNRDKPLCRACHIAFRKAKASA